MNGWAYLLTPPQWRGWCWQARLSYLVAFFVLMALVRAVAKAVVNSIV